MTDDPGAAPAPIDVALYREVLSALDELPPGVALHDLVLNDQAGLWVVHVLPLREGAAPLIALVDGNTLNLTVGNIWFEVFGASTAADLTYARDVARVVFAGGVEEVGPRHRAHGRLLFPDRVERVGHVPLGWTRPSRWRRYEPYA